MTRVARLELRVTQDRDGRLGTEPSERYQRSEKALVAAMAEMYAQAVSTRKVAAVTERRRGHRFSASGISRLAKRLNAELEEFADPLLDEACPYLIFVLRYEKVRQGGQPGRDGCDEGERRWTALRAGGGAGKSREQIDLARLRAEAQTPGACGAWSSRCGRDASAQ